MVTGDGLAATDVLSVTRREQKSTLWISGHMPHAAKKCLRDGSHMALDGSLRIYVNPESRNSDFDLRSPPEWLWKPFL